MTAEHTPHSSLVDEIREVAPKYAHHHNLCDTHKGGECDCYASHKFGHHRLAFLALDLVEQLEAMHRSSNFHPYECDGIGVCEHCDRLPTKDHDPATCSLCDPEYDYAPNPFRQSTAEIEDWEPYR